MLSSSIAFLLTSPLPISYVPKRQAPMSVRMATSTPDGEHSILFRNRLPPSRLGISHASLEAFQEAAQFTPSSSKEFTLIVVTEPERRRILLGRKHRGFGTGMYNSFGGKIDPEEKDFECAARELEEETGIQVEASEMAKRKIAVLRFTFDDDPTEMVVHAFRLDVTTTTESTFPPSASTASSSAPYIRIDANDIRPCDEITPQWFENWHDLPLDNMFADDSVWLTRTLSSNEPLYIDGYFHFEPGGQHTNTIRHYYMDVRPKTKRKTHHSLEQRLFHKLHSNKIHSPSIKEFKEAYAFTNTARSFFGKDSIDLVLDVAGGHGGLAALLLIMTSAREAVVIDPADVGSQNVQRAWGEFLQDKTLRYRHECLRTGLPAELKRADLDERRRILVVGCHACQHLSDEILSIACRFGVSVAVMPCCQKDASPGSSWKATSKNLGIPIDKTMDLLLAGKAMSWNVGNSANASYDVRMKTIEETITPQNRIIMCRPRSDEASHQEEIVRDKAHRKLEVTYQKAHERLDGNWLKECTSKRQSRGVVFGIGIAIGILVSGVIHRR